MKSGITPKCGNAEMTRQWWMAPEVFGGLRDTLSDLHLWNNTCCAAGGHPRLFHFELLRRLASWPSSGGGYIKRKLPGSIWVVPRSQWIRLKKQYVVTTSLRKWSRKEMGLARSTTGSIKKGSEDPRLSITVWRGASVLSLLCSGSVAFQPLQYLLLWFLPLTVTFLIMYCYLGVISSSKKHKKRAARLSYFHHSLFGTANFN